MSDSSSSLGSSPSHSPLAPNPSRRPTTDEELSHLTLASTLMLSPFSSAAPSFPSVGRRVTPPWVAKEIVIDVYICTRSGPHHNSARRGCSSSYLAAGCDYSSDVDLDFGYNPTSQLGSREVAESE
jgi:hypothetical protein